MRLRAGRSRNALLSLAPRLCLWVCGRDHFCLWLLLGFLLFAQEEDPLAGLGSSGGDPESASQLNATSKFLGAILGPGATAGAKDASGAGGVAAAAASAAGAPPPKASPSKQGPGAANAEAAGGAQPKVNRAAEREAAAYDEATAAEDEAYQSAHGRRPDVTPEVRDIQLKPPSRWVMF